MKELLKNEANITYTENGAVTYLSSNSALVDLFSTIGALRVANEQEIIDRFEMAFAEDRTIAMKILFFARDIRGGLGERRVFDIILKHLANAYPESVEKNVNLIAEFGRFDDLLQLLRSPCERQALEVIETTLKADKATETPSLLAKWLPSINTSNKDAVANGCYIAKKLGLSNVEYRKLLVALRAKIRIIENNLREKNYTFDYAKQPSKAMFKYKKAFLRNDLDRYTDFMRKVESGEAKLNVGTLYPYDIVRNCMAEKVSKAEKGVLDTTWKRLKESIQVDDNALAVIDGSGSMYDEGRLSPIEIAISLGILFGECNKGDFKNSFITFSEKPQLVEIRGEDIFQKVQNVMAYNDCSNTNIQKVFELILKTAVKHKLPQSELPSALYIISDMEFDEGVDNGKLTNFENAKAKFEASGYKLPKIIFWNVQSRTRQNPVQYNEQGVCLVSGASPKLFERVVDNNVNPLQFMLDIVNSERYSKIVG
ncbi:MAG: DUF2828 family protein [Clostridia bacterium]